MRYTILDTDLGITIARFATPADVYKFFHAYGPTGGALDVQTLDK